MTSDESIEIDITHLKAIAAWAITEASSGLTEDTIGQYSVTRHDDLVRIGPAPESPEGPAADAFHHEDWSVMAFAEYVKKARIVYDHLREGWGDGVVLRGHSGRDLDDAAEMIRDLLEDIDRRLAPFKR